MKTAGKMLSNWDRTYFSLAPELKQRKSKQAKEVRFLKSISYINIIRII